MREPKNPLLELRELLEDVPAFGQALEASASSQQQAGAVTAPWLDALVRAAYLVALADGVPEVAERELIAQGLIAICNGQIGAPDIERAMERVLSTVHAERASKLVHEIAEQIVEPALREAAFLIAFAAGYGDGSPNSRKALAIQALGHAFGFSEGKLQSLLARARQVL